MACRARGFGHPAVAFGAALCRGNSTPLPHAMQVLKGLGALPDIDHTAATEIAGARVMRDALSASAAFVKAVCLLVSR